MGRLRRFVVLFVAAWLLAACGGGTGGNGGGGGAEGRASDEVFVAAGEDIWPLTGAGPSAKHFAAGELSVGVYEPLVTLAPDFTVQPGLAERWELVEPLRWRFHLRPGVRFHDGRPFGADDVVWSWTGRQFLPSAVTNTLSTVIKVDDATVDFVTSSPNLRLPEQLVHPEGPIVPRNGHNDSTPPVGTGPFRVVDYRPRQRVVVERFDGYWGEKAKVRKVTFLFLPEAAARIEALRTGDADIATNVPAAAVGGIAADKRFRVLRAPLGLTQSLTLDSPEPEVRQAVGLAVDRAAYVATVLKNEGEPARGLAPPAVLGSSAALVQLAPFDPARARALLDSTAWKPGSDGVRTKDGKRLTLVLIGGPAVPEAGLTFVQGQLRDVGMEVAVKKAEDTVTYQEYRQKGWDLDLGQSNQNDANPAFLPSGRSSAELVAAALAADSRESVQRLAARMTQTIVGTDFRVVPLAHLARTYAVRQGVDLGTLHPSAINQSWAGVSARS